MDLAAQATRQSFSRVLATCGTINMDASNFMLEYFMKERVLQVWCGELRGFRVVENFATLDIAQRTWFVSLCTM